MFQQLQHIPALIRFNHTLFALPFALLSAAIAWREAGTFSWLQLLGIVLCMTFARSAAMAFNRLVDCRIDARNARTAKRHLPAGMISVPIVVTFLSLCCVGFVASTLLFLPNQWPLILSGPVLLFLLGYSLAKRFTSWCHYWLAAALMLAPIAAWIAITGTLAWPPVLLAVVVFFWVGGFDIIYACQDYEFDKEEGLKSIPARFGIKGALKIAAASHLLMLLALTAFWWVSGLGMAFVAGIIIVAGLLIYEHRLVSPDDLARVNIAFFHINSVISLGLFAVCLVDIWLMT